MSPSLVEDQRAVPQRPCWRVRANGDRLRAARNSALFISVNRFFAVSMKAFLPDWSPRKILHAGFIKKFGGEFSALLQRGTNSTSKDAYRSQTTIPIRSLGQISTKCCSITPRKRAECMKEPASKRSSRNDMSISQSQTGKASGHVT